MSASTSSSSTTPTITFDEDGRVRVLEAEKYKQTEELAQEARAFVQKITEFTDIVHAVVESLGTQAEVIEKAKLKAIGQRNLVETERELLRRRKARGVQALLEERAAELARLEAEYSSLLAVEAEQKEFIEKLSNNEPALL